MSLPVIHVGMVFLQNLSLTQFKKLLCPWAGKLYQFISFFYTISLIISYLFCSFQCYSHNIIVVIVVADGATENRTALRTLATETVEDILGDHLTDEMKEIFPMDFKIAFWHPIRKNILIFISADMPHLVKKSECFWVKWGQAFKRFIL